MLRSTFLLVALIFIPACAIQPTGEDGSGRAFGPAQSLGKGDVQAFVDFAKDGQPLAYGILVDRAAFDGLPPERNRTSRCFDVNDNGTLDMPDECEGDEERYLDLPAAASADSRIPVRWIGMNWNPIGHFPHAWSLPHFDFHFYIQDFDAVQAIRTGPCGILINCEDFETATRPVDDIYVAPDYVSVDAAVPAMGNHLIDTATPELAEEDPAIFTHTFIYGTYDGRISFIEPMITRAFLLDGGDQCFPIRQPQAWQQAGYYPTVYCVHGANEDGSVVISLESLEYREASAK